MNGGARLGPATRRTWLIAVGAVFGLELAMLAVGYQLVASLDCDATSAAGLCSFLGSFIARGIAVIAAFGLVLWARPAATRTLARRIETRPLSMPWLVVHLAGLALLFAPLATARADGSIAFDAALLLWLTGGAAAAIGALFVLAPLRAWIEWARALGWLPLAALVAAFLLPDLTKMAQPLWDLSAPSLITFQAVHALLDLAGTEPNADFAARVTGVNGFRVEIAKACSGVEGVALLVGFAVLYTFLFRAQLRLGRLWLTAVPVGIAASLVLNAVRIAVLVAIGAYLSPDFALNGFHSYAGWMLFTALAMALLCCAHSIGWLQRGGQMSAARPLRSDWSAACIVPFLTLMAADVAIAALFPDPALAYPLRLLVGAAAVGAFWHAYSPAFGGPVDWKAVGVGVAIGMVWLMARSDPSGPEPGTALAGLGGMGLATWAVARVAGTVLLVPLVEELFFRGYVLARLDGPTPARRLVAVAASSAMFGAMHERWLVAFFAGVAFAMIYLRQNGLSNAIVAHFAANLVVAAWALAAGDWTAI